MTQVDPPDPVDQQVNLHARDGAFITALTLPVFVEMPQVLLWSTRCFTWNVSGGIYIEATSFVVPGSP